MSWNRALLNKNHVRVFWGILGCTSYNVPNRSHSQCQYSFRRVGSNTPLPFFPPSLLLAFLHLRPFLPFSPPHFSFPPFRLAFFHSCRPSFLSFLPSFLPAFLPLLPPFLASFLPSFPSFFPSSLPSVLPYLPFTLFLWNVGEQNLQGNELLAPKKFCKLTCLTKTGKSKYFLECA